MSPCRPVVHCSASTPHDRDSCGAAHSPQAPSRTHSHANVLAALSDRPPSLADLLGPYFLVLNTPQVADATLQVGLQVGSRCNWPRGVYVCDTCHSGLGSKSQLWHALTHTARRACLSCGLVTCRHRHSADRPTPSSCSAPTASPAVTHSTPPCTSNSMAAARAAGHPLRLLCPQTPYGMPSSATISCTHQTTAAAAQLTTTCRQQLTATPCPSSVPSSCTSSSDASTASRTG